MFLGHYGVALAAKRAALVVWGALIGGSYYAVRRDARGAWVVGALVLSH